MLRALLLLLLLLTLCGASVMLHVGTSSPWDSQGRERTGCEDWRGRPGHWVPYTDPEDCRNGACYLVARYICATPDLPPRLTQKGLWECDEFYELSGARFSWEGGVFAVQPEKCRPV